MALINRRQFGRRIAFAAAALYSRPVTAVARAGRVAGSVAQQSSPLDTVAVRKLASVITGHVVTSESQEYESARLVFNRAFDQRPALIVRCAGVSDVARVLDFAQNHALPLAV